MVAVLCLLQASSAKYAEHLFSHECSIGMQRKLPYYPALIVTPPHRFPNYSEAAAGELSLPIEGEINWHAKMFCWTG